MSRRPKTLLAAVAALCLGAPAYASSIGALTQPATSVTDNAATLHGEVTPKDTSTTYYFDYGATDAYGSQTPVTYVTSPDPQAVQATITELEPATPYHFRLVAVSKKKVAYGIDETFTTGAAPSGILAPPAAAGPLGGVAPPGGGVTPPGGGVTNRPDGSRPVLGRSVETSPAVGSITVRLPGKVGFRPLTGHALIPVGSTVDSRRGAVNLKTAVGRSGSTQSATFGGAIFRVWQNRSARGVTDIVLRGGSFAVCRGEGLRRASHTKALTAARGPRVIRRLWGRDHHGLFRTRGKYSVATVRGTKWVMAERCDGTLTHVTEGMVSVRDRGSRENVPVHAGESHLARAPR